MTPLNITKKGIHVNLLKPSGFFAYH